MRGKDKLEVPIAGRITASRFRTLENWRLGSYRKRSEVVGMVLDRVLEILEQQAGMRHPVESFVERLHLDPPL